MLCETEALTFANWTQESSVAAFEARIRATKTFQHLYGDIDRGRPRHIVKSIAQHLTASENAQITEDKGNTSLSPHRVGGAGNKGLNRRSNSLAPDWDRAVTMPWETSPFVARGSTAYVTGSASEPFNDIDMGDIYVHANNHLRVRDHTPAPSEMTFFDLSCIAPEQVPKPSIETSTISSTNNDISGSQRYKKRQPKESVTSNAPSSETVRLRPTLASEHSVSKSTLSRRYDSISSPSFGSSSLHSPATVIANKPNRGPTLDSGIASQTNSEDKNNAQSLRGSASHHRQQREEVNSTQVFNAPSVSLRSSSPPSSRKLSLSMSISPPSGLSQISAAGSSRPSVHSSRISSVIDWEESTAEKARLVSSWFHGRSPATRSPGYSNDASLQHPESGRRPELQNSALVVAESADSLEPFSTIYPAETTSTGRNRSDSSVGHRLKDSDSIDPRDEVFVKNLLKAAYEAYYPDVPFPVSLFERRDRPEPFSVLSNIVRLRQTRDVADLDMTDVSGVSDVSDKTPTVARPGDGPNKLNDAGTVSSLSKHHTASDGDAAGAATRTYTKTVVSANADGEKEVFYELELEHDRGEFSESLSNIDGSPMSSSDDEQGGVRTATVRTADATHSVHSVHSAHSIHDGETIHDGFERAERAERHESVERATDAEGDTPMTNYDYGDDDDENGHEDVKKQEAGKDGKATDEEADEKVDEEARFDEINDIIAEHFPAAEKGMAYRYDYDTADRLARNEKWAADETEWLDY
ncbi:hypothetical protein L228DRAFT_157203 [Xylona heveae TC161]|uniref:Uncharacterized protein n=1 Tax=Xylona heveae (strain CBS 132557 / TC161) TaxID=1328760 RepID=A0A165G2H8_XYLHT|nr:hypothetical protein L228DRAFT_157203 [Xylona heveae TC161]KZF21664.1 hypothetical protein L228DRAFT_157203 [Xylona heveae TC161]